LHSTPPLGVFPSEYRHPLWDGKIRMVSLPDGEKNSKISSFVLTWSTNVTDGQTDGQTDGRTDMQTLDDSKDRACIASRGKNRTPVPRVDEMSDVQRQAVAVTQLVQMCSTDVTSLAQFDRYQPSVSDRLHRLLSLITSTSVETLLVSLNFISWWRFCELATLRDWQTSDVQIMCKQFRGKDADMLCLLLLIQCSCSDVLVEHS